MSHKIAISYYPAILQLAECPSYIRRDAVFREILQTIDYDAALVKYDKLQDNLANLKISESGKKTITVTLETQIKLTILQIHLVVLTYNHIIQELNYKFYNQLLRS